MRSPFFRSKRSLSKATSSSSQDVISPLSDTTPSPPPKAVDADAFAKISVTSESPWSTPQTKSPSVVETLFANEPVETPSPRSSVPNSQQDAPECRKCGRLCTLHVTKTSNRNGNAGRPYYTCRVCGKFSCFVDEKGLDNRNPLCFCSKNSRRQLSNVENGRKIFYVCSTGACGFSKTHLRADGSEWSVGDDVAKAFAEIGIV